MGIERPGDRPYALADSNLKRVRRERLRDPHIQPLTEYVDELRTRLGPGHQVPCFDPLDGGVRAQLLFVLEAPGPQAVGSGFCSINNPDPTARNFLSLLLDAGIHRNHRVLWNVVPWYVGDGERISPPDAEDVRKAIPLLHELITLLPNLKAIILVGRSAQRILPDLRVPRGAEVLRTFHPSNRVRNRWPDKWEEIRQCLHQAARLCV